MSVESAVERYMRVVRTIGAQRPSEPDHDAFERFMREFHRDYPQATADQYERFKREAAAAAGVLVGHSEGN